MSELTMPSVNSRNLHRLAGLSPTGGLLNLLSDTLTTEQSPDLRCRVLGSDRIRITIRIITACIRMSIRCMTIDTIHTIDTVDAVN